MVHKNDPSYLWLKGRIYYYNCTSTINANSASSAINKWLKPRVPEGFVIHSLRDRLRAVQCPSDMIDQIGGWASAGVEQVYGLSYLFEKKLEWLIFLEEKQVQRI